MCRLTWQRMQRPRQRCVSFDMYRTNVVFMRMLSARIARVHVVYVDSVRLCKLVSGVNGLTTECASVCVRLSVAVPTVLLRIWLPAVNEAISSVQSNPTHEFLQQSTHWNGMHEGVGRTAAMLPC